MLKKAFFQTVMLENAPFQTSILSHARSTQKKNKKKKTKEMESYARKEYHGCSVRIERPVPRNHYLTSLDKASWYQTVAIGTDFSIRSEHPRTIPIILLNYPTQVER